MLRLAEPDARILESAREAMDAIGSRLRPIGETFCRRAIALYATNYDDAEVEELGRQLADMDMMEREAIVDIYDSMLASMTKGGSTRVANELHRIHSRISSFHTDYITQSRETPEWLLTNVAQNCDRQR